MQPLSAIDAISPAWEHTRALLFTRRRDWRLLLKIGFVAVFAQFGGCNSNFNSTGRHPLPHSIHTAAFTAVLLVFGLIALVLGLVLFYVSSRLQFVLFDIVLRRDTIVAPIWRRFGDITWRWIGLKLLFVLAAMLSLAPVIVPVLIYAVHNRGAHPRSPGTFILAIAGFVILILLLALVISAAFIVLLDFGLPFLALENTSIPETVHRLWFLFRSQPGAFLLYVLMRFLLGGAGALGTYLALLLGTLVYLIPGGALALLLWVGLRHAGPAGYIVMVAGWVVLALVLLVALFLAAVMMFGVVFTFIEAYALYFLAGRYPLLAAHLIPPPPAYLYTPPPPAAPPPDDNGPSFPMDPALA